jgi:16S rRNA C967 or C1407 C5-methylase (RsmB/RsmF family)/NOL1/NOP2/fmu family ribosome biogenesis protein
LHHSLPKELLASLEGVRGFDKERFEKVHEDGSRVTSIRWNPAKMPGGGVIGSKVPWSTMGYYLEERPSFTFDPLFHAGAYYVQEASSMFLEQALRQVMDLAQPLRVLDLCAAPGGKSTLIQSLLSQDSLLVSNEVIKTRVNVLEENMVKWGGANVVITCNDPRDFSRMENYFDVIVVDAPCSGSGLFRRDPDAIGEWSAGNVELCHQRQQRILADCWPALRKDGVLIYSTCSYSKAENEDILDWMIEELDASAIVLSVDKDWNIVGTAGSRGGEGYRFYPDKLKGEGFFITCVRKQGGGEFSYPVNRKQGSDKKGSNRQMSNREMFNKSGFDKQVFDRQGRDIQGSEKRRLDKQGSDKRGGDKLTKQDEERVRSWIREDAAVFLFLHNDHVYCLPDHLKEDLPYLQANCYLKRAGVMTGKLAGKDFIPEHELAVSTLIRRDLPAISLSKEEAIQYLRKEDIRPQGEQRGWMLVQYEGQNLGWIKALGNRVNNYYPKEWRILKRD